jgi:protein-disulfide isomerase
LDLLEIRRRPAGLREIIIIVLTGVRPLRYLALIVLLATMGCHAQSNLPAGISAAGSQPVQIGVSLSPDLARRVDVMIRSRSHVPSEYRLTIGIPTKSEIAGYDQIQVTYTKEGEPNQFAPFLLSTDGKTLAQFNKIDVSQDPKNLVSAVGRPARGGPENAPVLIVGFDDLECPYCAKMNAEIFPALLDRYKNQIRVVYRDFPLDEIHPWSMHAAVDSNCLGALSTTGYWNYIDYVHAHADEVPGKDQKSVLFAYQTLDKLAMDEGARQKVNATQLMACIQKQDNAKVKESMQDAIGDPLRINSTPILYVNGEKVEGVVSLEILDRVIDDALRAAGQTPPPAPVRPASPLATPSAPPAPVAGKPKS